MDQQGQPKSATNAAWNESKTLAKEASCHSSAFTALSKQEKTDRLLTQVRPRRHRSMRHERASEPPVRRSPHPEPISSNTRVAGNNDTDHVRSKSAIGEGPYNSQGKSPGKKHNGGSILGEVVRWFGMGEASSQADATEKAELLKRLEKMENDNKKMGRLLRDNSEKMEVMKREGDQKLSTTVQEAHHHFELLEGKVRAREEAFTHVQTELKKITP